jgi:TRAP-type mannitol/chloroaromatic compound transport system permease small subunit
MTFLRNLDRAIGGFLAVLQWLALPLVVLLFLQWPLRDIVHAHASQANDLGQIIFALFVAASVTAATRAGTHLAADTLAQRYSSRARHRLKKIGTAIGMVPWALFVLFAGASMVIPSVQEMEAFPETYNPGYYVIKLALWLMALLILAQSIVDIFRPDKADGH